jgi:hypothetical protein
MLNGVPFSLLDYIRSYITHFTQPDSIIPNPADPQSYNRYSYAQLNSETDQPAVPAPLSSG